MTDKLKIDPRVENVWRTYMVTGKPPADIEYDWYESKFLKPLVRLIPRDPRCRICMYPFEGIGGALSRMMFKLEPSRLNPQMCNVCERFAEKHQGGAEVETTLLFADVRGSTNLAEGMSPMQYSRLINRFYRVTTKELFRRGAMVEKLIGDAVTGFFVPGFSGPNHPLVAVETGKAILKATGHESNDGPWIPVGVGIHTGNAFIGAVISGEGTADISVLGDSVNIAARLSSLAGAGEVMMSETVRAKAGLDSSSLEARRLELKGKSEPLEAWIAKDIV